MATSVVSVNACVGIKQYLSVPNAVSAINKASLDGKSAERLIAQVMTLVNDSPKLVDCTPASILGGVIKAAAHNLVLNGPLGQAYLVPRWSKEHGAMIATFQVGYKGLIALAFRSSQVKDLPMRTVRAKDVFGFSYGTDHKIIHEPVQGTDRGDAIAYYAVAHLVNGGVDFEVMYREEVVAHRMKYSPPGKKGDYSAWATNFDEMAQKTCVRKLADRLPNAIALQSALADDNEMDLKDYLDTKLRLAADPAPERAEELNRRLTTGPVLDPEPEHPPEPDLPDAR